MAATVYRGRPILRACRWQGSPCQIARAARCALNRQSYTTGCVLPYEHHPIAGVFIIALVLAAAVDHRNRYYQSRKTRNCERQPCDCKWRHQDHHHELVHEQSTPKATLSAAAPMLVSILHLCPWAAENVPPSVVSGFSSPSAFAPAYPAPVLATTPASHVITCHDRAM
eukprot:COSAG02_NODE_5037_length_4704_cov_2.206253_5_plen_169_part_00